MRAVHLCIDLQHRESGWFHEDEWGDLVTNAFHLKRRLAGLGIPTIHVAFIGPQDSKDIEPVIGRMEDVCHGLITTNRLDISRDSRLAFGIPVTADELVAIKPAPSVTTSPPIMAYLREHAIETVILSGVFEARTPDIEKRCVSVSAVALVGQGYRAVIASEATNVYTHRPLPLEMRQGLHAPYGVAVEPTEVLLQPFVQSARLARLSRSLPMGPTPS